jgi:hypothetical protein
MFSFIDGESFGLINKKLAAVLPLKNVYKVYMLEKVFDPFYFRNLDS